MQGVAGCADFGCRVLQGVLILGAGCRRVCWFGAQGVAGCADFGRSVCFCAKCGTRSACFICLMSAVAGAEAVVVFLVSEQGAPQLVALGCSMLCGVGSFRALRVLQSVLLY